MAAGCFEESVIIQLSGLARSYCLAEIYVFGSRAAEIVGIVRGDKGSRRAASSDVDIAIRPLQDVKLSTTDRVRLTIALEDLLNVSRVDLVILPEADPFLALDIIRGELLYREDPVDQSRYELFVLRRAGDLLPLRKERMEMILRGQTR